MTRFLIALILFSLSGSVFSQKLYIKTFGSKKSVPLIFLHGGPGYNAAGFEYSDAELLAKEGFFVVVYDRRGEGRSEELKASYTFKESNQDILDIFQKYKFKKAVIMGHSFGGVIGTKFAEKYPEKVRALLLVGAPVNLQETFKTIIGRCKMIYTEQGNNEQLMNLEILQSLDSSSIQYSSICFNHAMINKFYTPKVPTDEARQIYEANKKNAELMKYASKMTFQPPMGFWQNEQYTTVDLKPAIKSLTEQKIPVYGLFGKDDGLYSEKQVNDLGQLIGSSNLVYYEQCSHNVFIDRRADFNRQLKSWFIK